jgi:transposase-like protein
MTRSKLSGPEKQEIAALFAQQQESIVSLAERYQVSASTIRRLLKNLPSPSAPKPDSPELEADTSQLVETEIFTAPSSKPKPIPRSLKNSEKDIAESDNAWASFVSEPLSQQKTLSPPSSVISQTSDSMSDQESSSPRPVRRIQLPKKVSADLGAEPELVAETSVAETIEESIESGSAAASFVAKPIRVDRLATPSNGVGSEEELSEILQEIGHVPPKIFAADALEEDADEEDESDDFDDLDDDVEYDFDDLDSLASGMQLKAEALVEVMPFAEAILPKTCYLVIDRTAELVTRPLKDFGELGQIPEAEVLSRTLPIFDNHRIARRFSHRNQRIIKVPDADMLKKTCTQLSAKGITRLLVNGHIYSL